MGKGKIMMIQSQNKPKAEEFEGKKDKKLLEMEKAITLILNKVLEEGKQIKGFLGIIKEVQALLQAVIRGDIRTAEKHIRQLTGLGEKDLFGEVGKITRKLHDSIREFQVDRLFLADPRILDG